MKRAVHCGAVQQCDVEVAMLCAAMSSVQCWDCSGFQCVK
uniref:Uncharacterized protein n=1 Tax=Anguilla anguilla TaxID=7936 RepID=A0A0E9PXI8_ANGAN